MLSKGQFQFIKVRLKSEVSSSDWQMNSMTSCQGNPSCIGAADKERNHSETYPIKDFLDWTTSPSGILAVFSRKQRV